MRRLGYLISQYPARSHTFILREIASLRTLGLSIDVASINAPDRSFEVLDVDEQSESRATFYIKSSAGSIWSGQVEKKLPFHIFRALAKAVALAGFNPLRIAKHLCYLGEAVILRAWMQRKGIDHLHVHFPNPAATVALLASVMTDIPFSMTIHGPDEFYDTTLYNLREKIESAQFLICISDFARSQLMKSAPLCDWSKFQVVPLGVDPDLFVPPLLERPSILF